MNYLMKANDRGNHFANSGMRFFKPLLLSTVFMFLFGVNANAQTRDSKTIICPAACPGTCWYLIDINKTEPDTNGCFDAHLNLFYGTTSEECRADIDRSLGGSVTYTVCTADGGAGEECNLSDKNFPDGSPFPIPPGTIPDDSTKEVLSEACYDAIDVEIPGGGTSGITYVFKNISSISADFNMRVFCMCANGGGTPIIDTMKFKYGMTPEDEVPDEDIEVAPDGGEEGGRSIDHAETIYNEIGYGIERIYPNPFTDVINVRMTIDEPEEFQFTIIDQYGNHIQHDVMNLPAGQNDVPIHLQKTLESGHYYYLLIHRESGRFSTTKIYMK